VGLIGLLKGGTAEPEPTRERAPALDGALVATKRLQVLVPEGVGDVHQVRA